jgi:hypothetical protein
MRNLSKFKSLLSRRTTLVIIGAQVALLILIAGVVVANSVTGPTHAPSEAAVTPEPEITGALLVATPSPSPLGSEGPETKQVEVPSSGDAAGRATAPKALNAEPYPGYNNTQACVLVMNLLAAASVDYGINSKALWAEAEKYRSGELGPELTSEERNAIDSDLMSQAQTLGDNYRALQLSYGYVESTPGSFGCDGTQTTPRHLG